MCVGETEKQRVKDRFIHADRDLSFQLTEEKNKNKQKKKDPLHSQHKKITTTSKKQKTTYSSLHIDYS